MSKYLIIAPIQYGYNTDFYKYSECLADENEVYYLGLDKKQPIRHSEKVHVYTVQIGKLGWLYALLLNAYKLSKTHNFDNILVYNFPFCHLLCLIFSRNKMVMDIRTSYIHTKIKSFILNKDIWYESLFFKKISVISFGVGKLLGVSPQKSFYLPLGSDPGVMSNKQNVKGLKLLYVGTFYRRNIHITVEGISLFLKNNPNITPDDFQYTIIGNGPVSDCEKIKCKILEYDLCSFINYVGEVRFEALVPYFKENNIGVSFIPLTDYYDCQPPTKTFEYLLNSMIVLGTSTTENCNVINSQNGVLTKDTPEDFANGLQFLNENISNYDFVENYNDSLMFSWKFITDNYLLRIFKS